MELPWRQRILLPAQGLGSDPWSWKIPHAQRVMTLVINDINDTKPTRHNHWSLCSLEPVWQNKTAFSATRESTCAARNTNTVKNKNKLGKKKKGYASGLEFWLECFLTLTSLKLTVSTGNTENKKKKDTEIVLWLKGCLERKNRKTDGVKSSKK